MNLSTQLTIATALKLLLLLFLVDTSLCLSTPNANIATRREALLQSTQSAIAVAALIQPSSPANAAYIDPATDLPKVTNRVFIDVQIGSDDSSGPSQRIVMGLFGGLLPRVTENFVALCRDNMYAGTTFYRVISDVTVQGGAIDGGKSGKTGQSSSLHDGNPFEPDNYDLKHSTLGLVSMVRGVGGSVDSRFFINTAPGETIYNIRYILDRSNLFHDYPSKS